MTETPINPSPAASDDEPAILTLDNPWNLARVDDPTMARAERLADAAKRRYSFLAAAKAAELLRQLIPDTHTVLLEVTHDRDSGDEVNLLALRDKAGALLWFGDEYDDHPDAVALAEADNAGGKPVPIFDTDTLSAIESLVLAATEDGCHTVLRRVRNDPTPGLPVGLELKLREQSVFAFTVPDVIAEARHYSGQIVERCLYIEGITSEAMWRDLERSIGLPLHALGRFKEWSSGPWTLGQEYDLDAAVAWVHRNGLPYVDERHIRYEPAEGSAKLDRLPTDPTSIARVARQVRRMHKAAEGDSNDYEIDVLRDLAELLMDRWPEVDFDSGDVRF